MMNISKNVKRYAAGRGIALKDLAEKIGMTPSALSRIINGEGNATLATLKRIADPLGVSLSDLLRENGDFAVDGYVSLNGAVTHITSAEQLISYAKRLEEMKALMDA